MSSPFSIAENVPPSKDIPVDRELALGITAVENKQYSEAVNHLEAAVGRDPKNLQARRLLGKALLRSGEPAKAIAVYTEAIRLNPSMATTYAERAQALAAVGNRKEALEDLGKAVEIDPENAEFRFVRGSLLSIEERYDAALDDFSAAILSDPYIPEPYFARGTLRQMRGENRQAIADFDKALSLRPEYPSALANRALAYLLNGDYEKVIAGFDAAVALNPRATDDGGYGLIAWFLATFPDSTLRDGKKAMKYGLTACELSDWKDASKLEYYAAACAEAGKFEEAIRWQTKAVELKGAFPENLRTLATGRLELYKAGKPFHQDGKSPEGSE